MEDQTVAWVSVLVSLAILIGYELRLVLSSRKGDSSTARSAHLSLRAQWVRALAQQPGAEIIGIQALRNSLMSATINASTAALVLMGSVSLIASRGGWEQEFSVRVLLEGALLFTLFATYLCAALSMRFYHHAGFAVSLPVGSLAREQQSELAVHYVQRGGVLYSWSLHFFLNSAPIVVGLLNPIAMPLATLCMLLVLALFDRAPKHLVDSSES